jgi:hypothetical protein
MRTGQLPTVYTKPTAYRFDAENPSDRAEAAAELLRLADWPAKNWIGLQADLPLNLVDFVRDRHSQAPAQPLSESLISLVYYQNDFPDITNISIFYKCR